MTGVTAGSSGAPLTVLLTRPRPQAEPLARALAEAGMAAWVFPTLEIVPAAPALRVSAPYDCTIFISANAVEHGFDHAFGAGVPPGARVAAIGGATAAALRARGVERPIAPSGTADSESLLALPELADVAGWRVLVVRGIGGREALAQGLRSRGAEVDYLECYRRSMPACDAGALVAAWKRGGIDAVNAMSSETLSNLDSLVGVEGHPLLARAPVFVPHERIAAAARALGIDDAVVYEGGDAGLVSSLRARFPHHVASHT